MSAVTGLEAGQEGYREAAHFRLSISSVVGTFRVETAFLLALLEVGAGAE